jgi:hypothetical protein
MRAKSLLEAALLSLVLATSACSSGGGGGGHAGAGGAAGHAGAGGGAGSTAGSAGSTAGSAGSTAGTAGSTAGAGGSAGSTAGAAGSTAGAGGGAGAAAGSDGGVGATAGAAGASTDGGSSDATTSDASASDAAAEAGASDGGSDAATVACGTAPYVQQGVFPGSYDGLKFPVTVTSTACPGVEQTVSSNTSNQKITVPKVAQAFRFAATGYVPAWLPELTPPSYDQGFAMLKDGAINDIFNSGVNRATQAEVIPQIGSVGQTAPCDAKDGVSYSVTGHAEAVVKYLDNGGQVIAAATATSAAGSAVIVLTPTSKPEKITIVATKTGCTLSTITPGSITGASYVEAGATTLQPLVLKN